MNMYSRADNQLLRFKSYKHTYYCIENDQQHVTEINSLVTQLANPSHLSEPSALYTYNIVHYNMFKVGKCSLGFLWIFSTVLKIIL